MCKAMPYYSGDIIPQREFKGLIDALHPGLNQALINGSSGRPLSQVVCVLFVSVKLYTLSLYVFVCVSVKLYTLSLYLFVCVCVKQHLYALLTHRLSEEAARLVIQPLSTGAET